MTDPAPTGIALALARIGAEATRRLSTALAGEGVTPPHLGVLRHVGQQPGISQQELAVALGVAPSRVVALVDDLESRGLVERRRSSRDRRVFELYTPATARKELARIRAIVRAHDASMTAQLTDEEKAVLLSLLAKIPGSVSVPGIR